jgi:uncharacterized protein YjbI with pentapeptide repeats
MITAVSLGVDLSNQKFQGVDFSSQNLAKKKVTGSKFINCSFDDADMSEGDFEHCDFTGSSFRRTNLYYTSFKRSKLACTVFEPRNVYGITFTLECKTFQNMMIDQANWYYYVMLASMMIPGKVPVKENLVDKLIAMIGAERYVKLKALFERREI